MQTILDAIARSFANTPLKAGTRQSLVDQAVANLGEVEAERFTNIAFERGEFAPSE